MRGIANALLDEKQEVRLELVALIELGVATARFMRK